MSSDKGPETKKHASQTESVSTLIQSRQYREAVQRAKRDISSVAKSRKANKALRLVDTFHTIILNSHIDYYSSSLEILAHALALVNKEDPAHQKLSAKQAQLQLEDGCYLLINDSDSLEAGANLCLKAIIWYGKAAQTREAGSAISRFQTSIEISLKIKKDIFTWLVKTETKFAFLLKIMEKYHFHESMASGYQRIVINLANKQMNIAGTLSTQAKAEEAIPYYQKAAQSFESAISIVNPKTTDYLHTVILLGTCYANYANNLYNLKQMTEAKRLFKIAMQHWSKLQESPAFRYCMAPWVIADKKQSGRLQAFRATFRKNSLRQYESAALLIPRVQTLLSIETNSSDKETILKELQLKIDFMKSVKNKSKTATFTELRTCMREVEILTKKASHFGMQTDREFTQSLNYLFYNLSLYLEPLDMMLTRLTQIQQPTDEIFHLRDALHAYFQRSEDSAERLIIARSWFDIKGDPVWVFYIDCLYFENKLHTKQVTFAEMQETVGFLFEHFRYLASAELCSISLTKLFFTLDKLYQAIRAHSRAVMDQLHKRAEHIPYLKLNIHTLQCLTSLLPFVDSMVCEQSKHLYPDKQAYTKSVQFELSALSKRLDDAEYDVRVQSNFHEMIAEELLQAEKKGKQLRAKTMSTLKYRGQKKQAAKKVVKKSPVHGGVNQMNEKKAQKRKHAKQPTISAVFSRCEVTIHETIDKADDLLRQATLLDPKEYVACIKLYQEAIEHTQAALELTKQLSKNNRAETSKREQYLEHCDVTLDIFKDEVDSLEERATAEKDYLGRRYQWLKANGKIKKRTDGTVSPETLLRKQAEQALELCPETQEALKAPKNFPAL